jgi:RTX calcium-binding nonapeptide repeat (4 copies)
MKTAPFLQSVAVVAVVLTPALVGAEPEIGCALRVERGEPAQHVGTNGDDECDGLSGRDFMRGLRGDDRLRGMKARDIVKGDRGADLVVGRRGNDRVVGGRGPDFLKGGKGNDVLKGGKGPDVICLGRGTNRATSRDGARDRVYAAHADDVVAVDRRDKISSSRCPKAHRRSADRVAQSSQQRGPRQEPV